MTIDFALLRPIGLNSLITLQLGALPAPAPTPGLRLARIVQVHRQRCVLDDGLARIDAQPLPSLASTGATLAVGDWVWAAPSPGHDALWIVERLPPCSQLERRSGDGRRQALATNVDTALMVMGLDHDFNLRRLERYIALSKVSGVTPVVVLTKLDSSVDATAKVEQLRQRLPPGVEVIALDARAPTACELLAPWLAAGQTLVLLGSSGAGKSTLTNTLCASEQRTGSVRADDSRGRHTTSARSLHRCDSGACIIDTPGLRSWSLDAGADEVAHSFEDIEALGAQCRFRSCRHGDEPGCAVRGGVDADRIANYGKLLREAERATQTPLQRIEERARWKVLSKAAQARNRSKRGG